VIAGDAELAARVATDRLARGPVHEAERYLALAARALESVPADRLARARVILAVARMRLARQRGDLPAVAEEAHRLLAPAMTAESAEPQLGGDLRALALIDLGAAEVWSSRFDEADRHLTDGIALARRIGRPYLEVAGLANEAQLMSWRSFPAGAQRSLEAIELATRHGWADEPIAGVAYLALGVAMVTQGRLGEAEQALGRAERTVRTEADPAAGMRLVYGRGMLEFISGRHDAALRAFQAAERLAESLVSPHTLAPRLRSHLLQTLARRSPDPALPAYQALGPGDRRRAVPVGEHGQDPHAPPVRQARRAPPPRGRRAGPRPRPAGTLPAQILTDPAAIHPPG
jgi:LuxR family maltose regulon positive regulatory protein